MNSVDIKEGSVFSISLGGCVAHSAVFTSMLHVHVVAVTDKAIRVKTYSESGTLREATCWLPRKALVKWTGDDKYGWRCALALWFKAAGYTANFINEYASNSGVSA
jgi:hypothetical protein